MGAALPAPERQAPDEAESGDLEPVQFLACTKGTTTARTGRLLLQRPRNRSLRASIPSLPKMPGTDHSAQMFTPPPLFLKTVDPWIDSRR